jgi:ATP-dependent helicase/DNAse subunit B
MESLIYKCIKNVQDGKFDIYPLKIEKEHDACRYCSYKDICYRKFKDFNIQEIKKEDDDNE